MEDITYERGYIVNLLEKLQVSTKYEVNLALPNEIFGMLMDEKIKPIHRPFAYSYIYFVTYMYRYGKYEQFMANQSDIKEVLGYARDYKSINYLFKENGVLEQLGLLETTKNIPISYKYDRTNDFVEIMYFQQYKDLLDDAYEWQKKAIGITSRTTVKRPRFAYIRDLSIDLDIVDEDDYTGTFYSAKNTHIIDFRIFDFCMNHNDLGIIGFYIYSYLKHKNDVHGGYDASRERLAQELGLSTSTISRYRDALRKYNLVDLVHNMVTFSSRMKKEEYLAPSNYTHDFDKLVPEGIVYEKFLDNIERKGDKKTDTYTIKFKDGTTKEVIHIEENLLPF